jgi:hypothetical protein
MVVMPAKHKVRAEVEILLAAMARDVRRVRYAKASPQFISSCHGIYFLNGETGHREVEWRRQICPKSIAVEVGSIENIPRSIDSFALCVFRGMAPSTSTLCAFPLTLMVKGMVCSPFQPMTIRDAC